MPAAVGVPAAVSVMLVGVPAVALNPTDYYYVRGVGRIRIDYGAGDREDLRYWQVN